MTLKRVAVFCASRPGLAEHRSEARALGNALGRRGYGLVYGGAQTGLMGDVADAALNADCEVIGVLPEGLADRERAHEGLTRLEIVSTMHERKARMASLADGFVILPGGFGTLDECFEALTWAQLGLHPNPLAIVNTGGFYTPLLTQIRQLVDAGYVAADHEHLLQIADSAEHALDQLESATRRISAA